MVSTTKPLVDVVQGLPSTSPKNDIFFKTGAEKKTSFLVGISNKYSALLISLGL